MKGQPRTLRVLVTGAGGGIGRAVAERLARGGHHVFGTVRHPDRALALENEARGRGPAVRYRALEYPSMTGSDALVEELEAAGGLDVLVNNAGTGVLGALETVGPDDAHRQLAVNLLAPLDLTRRLLPALRASRGCIIWIGSLAGRFALPFQAHYSASKAAVAALSDALRLELRPHGVRVSCVEPGDFSTGFTAARKVVHSPDSAYAAAQARCLDAVEWQERRGPGPDEVAAVVARLCAATDPPARVPVGRMARTMCLGLRLLPDRVREWAVRRTYRL